MAPVIAQMKALTGLLATRVLPIGVPKVISGEGSSNNVGETAKDLNITKVLLVTDEILTNLGLVDGCMQSLKDSGVEVFLFNKVLPDPTVDIALEGLQIYLESGCDGIIAFGGGSPMDCAKLIATLSTDPMKDPKSFMGMLPLTLNPFGSALPPLIAIPTTAGTGSEATIAAVITFPLEEKKYNLIDPKLVPTVAILDPLLLKKLPPPITAATGMDALTHAVESFLSQHRTDFTVEHSLKAVRQIFKYLPICYEDGDNMEAREALLQASYDAGVAFTRANVGYVHAIAHQLGALFHVPHGVANSMVLPFILEFYQQDCCDDFAQLAIAAGLKTGNESTLTLASKFTQAVRKMKEDLKIPSYVKGMSASHVRQIAERAINEAHGDTFSIFSSPLKYLLDIGYPVPKYMTLEECENLVSKLVDPSAPARASL